MEVDVDRKDWRWAGLSAAALGAWWTAGATVALWGSWCFGPGSPQTPEWMRVAWLVTGIAWCCGIVPVTALSIAAVAQTHTLASHTTASVVVALSLMSTPTLLGIPVLGGFVVLTLLAPDFGLVYH